MEENPAGRGKDELASKTPGPSADRKRDHRHFRAPGPGYSHRWGWFLAPAKGKNSKEDRLEEPRLKGVKRAYHVFEKYLPIFTSVSFVGGVILGKFSPSFGAFVDNGISSFINAYGYFAPVAIYLILTPALLRIVQVPKGNNGKRFGTLAISFFAQQRFLACFWACLFTATVFGLPFYVNGTNTFSMALMKTLKSFGWMVTHSIYFYALYASILTMLISLRFRRLEAIIRKPSDWIEAGGRYLVPIMPFFMLAIGSYVAHLDVSIAEQVGSAGNHPINPVRVFGIEFSQVKGYGMVWIYLMGALATAAACWVWHLGLLTLAKIRLGSGFSLQVYFKKYWPRVYPLLWATSSESIGMPLNLNLVQRYFPHIPTDVRRFCVGGGSFLSINGTMICVFVLAGLVSQILGLQISLLHLLMLVPIVFLMGYGVPGIPGELILFGGPIVAMFGLSPELAEVFLTLYVGLQIGLPDSFRSATNSTDNCVSAHLMAEVYERKYAQQPAVVRESARGGGMQPVMGGLTPALDVRQLRAETRSVFPTDFS